MGGGLASGPGTAIGSGLALKDSDRTVVAVLGDGDTMQGSSALWTAAHYDIPVLILVSNNRSNFNDEIHQETVAKVRGRSVENRWIGQRIDDPQVSIADYAAALGVAVAGGPAELVRNGSFEAGASVPDGWTLEVGARSGDRGAESRVVLDHEIARGGKRSLRLSGDASTVTWFAAMQRSRRPKQRLNRARSLRSRVAPVARQRSRRRP